MRVRVTAGCWGVVAVMTVQCFTTGRLAAQDSFAGTKPGQELTQRPWFGTFCWCPPGKFTMGEKNDPRGNARQVNVTITRGFWMGKYEVTQAQYQFVMGKNPSYFKGVFRPVEWVTWHEAAEFCRKLTILARKAGTLPMGWEYRLPTEAQWEYACRAGSTANYSFGADTTKLGDYAWYLDNTTTKEGLKRLSLLSRAARATLTIDQALEMSGRKTHPVGHKKPNSWGLCDMHGNVMEYCRDWYQHKLPGGADPEVTKKANGRRTVRGGSWCAAATSVRAPYRLGNGCPPNGRGNNCGFRVAAVPIN